MNGKKSHVSRATKFIYKPSGEIWRGVLVVKGEDEGLKQGYRRRKRGTRRETGIRQ